MQFYNGNISWFEKAILKYILLFLSVFFVGRLIFISYNFSDFDDVQLSQVALSFIYGLRMDLSALSYLSPLVLILLFSYHQFQKKIFLSIFKILLGITFFFYFVIVIAELPIYDEWQTKLNSKAISYLGNISEVLRTATWAQIMATFILVPILTFFSVYLMNRFFKNKQNIKTALGRNISVLLFSLAVGFLGIRGGFYQIPLSVSAVFYSNNRTLNFATVNSFWSLGYGYYKESKYDEKDKYNFYTKEELSSILKNVYTKSDKSVSVLNTKTPNIIFVLFESWSADLVDSLDRRYHLMPNWRLIQKEGLFFSRCYATGRHSEEGILASLAGYPSLASSYLMGFTDKNAKLPTVNKQLATRNYQQSFFFGGDLAYANIKSFFYQNPFYKVKDEMDFPSNYIKGKLGYHDDALYSEMFKETQQSKQPFFIGGFTSSTHSPYDVPLPSFVHYSDRENDYMNSAHYADSCLGDFYQRCKKTDWFKNTLFVFVSDHSHPTAVKRAYCSPEDHRIVFMLLGGALKDEYKGKEVSKIMSQIDIPAILLTQLEYPTDAFIYSRNVLDSLYRPFAYFSDKTCQGTVNEEGFVRYSLTNDKLLQNNIGQQADSVVSITKALLQKSYNRFRNL